MTAFTSEEKIKLVQSVAPFAISYAAYREMVSDLASKGLSTSPIQEESLGNYTKLNDARMRRLDKKLSIPPNVVEDFKAFKKKQSWVVITESWCGDAAQSMPVMNALASLSDEIELKVVFRDRHPDLMDAFLTNGTRSIPKLIIVDLESDAIVAEWGPRPSTATQIVQEYKNTHGVLTAEFKKDLQLWYGKDKGQTIISDLHSLIS